MPNLPPETIIMAIDPTRKGFAFAVFETPDFLVDWGMKNAPPKSGDLRRKVDALLSRYQPSLLVVEDLAARGCRRRKRAKREIRSIEHLAATRGVPIERVPRLAVQNTFAPGRSKYEVAVNLAEIFPHIRSGAVRPIAFTSVPPSPELPGIPTVKESGIGDFDNRSGAIVRGRAQTFSKNGLFISCVITVMPCAGYVRSPPA